MYSFYVSLYMGLKHSFPVRLLLSKLPSRGLVNIVVV